MLNYGYGIFQKLIAGLKILSAKSFFISFLNESKYKSILEALKILFDIFSH